MFASIVTILIFISELGITDTTIMGIIIILFIPIEAWCLKNYLTGRKIIDLTDTKEGKKARLKFITLEASIVSSIFGLSEVVIYLVRTYKCLEVYMSITEIILTTLIAFVILFIVRVLTLKDEVKKYNSKK